MKVVSSMLVFVGVLCAGLALVSAQTPAALAATPQGKVVLAYYKAVRAGDAAGIKKLLTAESAKDLDGDHGKGLLQMLMGMTPEVAPTITKVTVTGKTASVDIQYKEATMTSADHYKLALVGTAWLLDMHAK